MLVSSLVAAMTTTCATSGVAYVIPALHDDHGVSLADAATLAAIPTIGLTLTIIAWGAALDRFGERRVLLVSLGVTLAGTVAALIVAATGGSVRALLREKGTPYAELGLDDPSLGDEALIEAILAHPILLNRPVVVSPKGTRLCRPSELVLDLLEHPVASFTKEDGEAVRR